MVSKNRRSKTIVPKKEDSVFRRMASGGPRGFPAPDGAGDRALPERRLRPHRGPIAHGPGLARQSGLLRGEVSSLLLLIVRGFPGRGSSHRFGLGRCWFQANDRGILQRPVG